MKQSVCLFAGLVIMAVLITGCTSQPAAAPAATPAPAVAAPVATEATHIPTTFLLDTTWKLGWYDDTKGMWSKVIEGSSITAKFTSDGKLTGFSGCSDYTTDYQLTDTPKIWIKRPTVPELVCQTPTGVMSQQGAYYTDLEWSQTYAMKDGQLLFYDKTGKKILQFDQL
ncbi:MAG: META domain-containing protein [Methanomicrobiales archaeon]|nr:META domain-containing protein [Methanomicrobiales archaeon]